MAKVILFLVLLCTFLMPHPSYGAGEQGYQRANLDVLNFGNRKVLSGVEMMMKKHSVDKAAGKCEKKQKESVRELREAPMGPDPLHHNGAPPRKPRTTP
ncbi:uncharacterized protein LOC141663886 [Apium graveolens]|uniref:uncharacterized protein LOC141663886 n=1 Tax=Apium graveolens TaxID=4045 RepID=UPI003D7AF4D9